MKVLFVGDVVGSSGREMLKSYLPRLKSKYNPDVILVNGENAAGGRGINKKIAHNFFEWGADAISLGNHTWDNKEIFDFIDDEPNLIRPANYPHDTPGRGYTIIEKNRKKLAFINAMGRTFLPPLDDPFRMMESILEEVRPITPLIIVDFHAEATSEKQAMGWFLDGKVSAVLGTHTHVQTADERILPGGTAYLTDVGMVGPYDSILGMDRDAVLRRFLTQLPVRFEVAKGRAQLNAVMLELDDKQGKALSIKRIRIDDDHLFM
ncbi:MAG: TIGR00282 family metallophosphoesterase [Bacillaceae bacterium]|nr:TIGR00282 family metallophosphoesterase [Bacillaceae bacterium]